MSKMRQPRRTVLLDRQGQAGAQMTTLSYDYPAGYRVPEHIHEEDQLVFARFGVMTISTRGNLWVVPPQRAVWIPGRTPHAIRMPGAVSMRTLYFAPGFARGVPRQCFVLNVSPLLRELTLHACGARRYSVRKPKEERLVRLILDLLRDARSIPLHLPAPDDPRARKVAERLLAEPAEPATLQRLCRECGASKRTIERLFLQQTGLSFGKWRQQLRVLHSIQRLAAGDSVTAVAIDSGYSSASAYIAAFRKSMGVTPGQYLAEGEG
jgi:AraC-like DNA-binding protein